MDKRDYFAVAVKDKFIDYDFNYIKEKINSEYKNINEEDFKKIIPITSDRRKLDEFYQQTGITVFYNYVTEEKSLFFNRCGAYPEYDEGWGRHLPASGTYFEEDGDIGLECDVLIEERVQYIGVTKDYKNYVIIPKGVQSEEIFEINDEFDEVFEIEEETMCGVDLSLEKFNRFYIQIN